MLLLLLAQTTQVDPVSWLVNYGVAGIVLALVVTGQLRTKSEVNGLTSALKESVGREREKDVAIAALMQQITSHTMPQLGQLTELIGALPQQTEVTLVDRLAALTAKIDKIERRQGETDG